MDIKAKLKEIGLNEDQLNDIEKSINSIIDEKVNELTDLKNDELINEYDEKSKKFIEEEVEKQVNEYKDQLTEATENWTEDFESNIIEKLDGFLDNEISENISDEALRESAEQYALKPIVSGVKSLLEKHGIEVNSTGEERIKDLEEKLDSKDKELSEAIDAKLEASKNAEKASVLLRINDAVEGLNESQIEKVKSIYSEKSFEEVDAKIDNYVKMIIKEDYDKDNDKNDLNEDKNIQRDGEDFIDPDANKNENIDTMEESASDWIE